MPYLLKIGCLTVDRFTNGADELPPFAQVVVKELAGARVCRAVLWRLAADRPRRPVALWRFDLTRDGEIGPRRWPALFLVRDVFRTAEEFFDKLVLTPFEPASEVSAVATLITLAHRAALVRESARHNLAYYTFPPPGEPHRTLKERRKLPKFMAAAEMLIARTREHWDDECASV